MNIIFSLAVLIGVLLIFVRKRRFDAYSIAFIGSVIYLSPGFFGITKYHVFGRWIATDIADTAYFLMISFILWIAISAYLYDKVYSKKISSASEINKLKRYGTENYQLMFLAFSACLGLLYQALIAPEFLEVEKGQMMSILGRGHILFEFCSIFGFCYALSIGKKFWSFIFILFLLFDAYLGFRFGIGVALGAAVCMRLFRNGPESFVLNNKLKIIAAIFVFIILIVYKQFAWGVKAGEWGMLKDMFLNGDVYIRSFEEMEPFIITNNLNQIVLSDYQYPVSEFLISVLRGIFPIGFLIGNEGKFDFQFSLFSEVDYGLAGNMLGEIWSVFGLYGFPFYLLFYSVFLAALNKHLVSKNPRVFVLALITIILFGIYFHRNSFEFQFLIMRRIFMIFLLVTAVHQILLMLKLKIHPSIRN